MFTVQIITPDRALPAVQVDHVTLPGAAGELGIRTGHAPIVVQLKAGRIELKSSSAANATYVVRGGVAQMLKNELKVLVEALVEPDRITESVLVQKLEALVNATYDDPMDHAKAKAEGQWYVAQLKAAGKAVPDVSKLGI